MKSNKILRIVESYFNLPDDFEGSLGDALTLLAEYTLEQEAKQQIHKEDLNIGAYNALIKDDDKKVTMKYNLCKLSQDGKKWIDLK